MKKGFTAARMETKKMEAAEKGDKVASWLKKLSLIPKSVKGEDVIDKLDDGVVISQLLNKMQPGIMNEVAHTDLVFKKVENLEKCAKACEEYGLKDVFSPDDLANKKNKLKVLSSLLKLKELGKEKGFGGDSSEESSASSASSSSSSSDEEPQPKKDDVGPFTFASSDKSKKKGDTVVVPLEVTADEVAKGRKSEPAKVEDKPARLRSILKKPPKDDPTLIELEEMDKGGKGEGNNEEKRIKKVRTLEPEPSDDNLNKDGNDGKKKDKKKDKDEDAPRRPALSRTVTEKSFIVDQTTRPKDMYDTPLRKWGKIIFVVILALVNFAAFIWNKKSLILFSQVKEADASVSTVVYSQLLLAVLIALGWSFLMDFVLWTVRENKTFSGSVKVAADGNAPREVEYHALILISVIEAILESIGIGILIFMVLPHVNEFGSLFVMNGLCIVPIFCTLLPAIYGGNKFSFMVIIRVIFFGMQVVGIILLIIDTKLYWEVPVSLVLTSLVWWRNFYSLSKLPPHWTQALLEERYGPSAVKCFLEIGFVIVFAVVFADVKLGIDPEILFTNMGASNFWSSDYWGFLISAVVIYLGIWLAVSGAVQRACFALPVHLATPATFALIFLQCDEFYSFSNCSYVTDALSGDNALVIVAGIVLWLSSVAITIYLWFGVDNNNPNQLERALWAVPEFSILYIDQMLALNRAREKRVLLQQQALLGAAAGVYDPNKHHKTFITITLYQEEEEEMLGMLQSLNGLNIANTEDEDRYEAHILFDNAVSGPKDKPVYNIFARQLFDLIEGKLGLKVPPIKPTWYGAVVRIQFPRRPEGPGLSMYVHMKHGDCVKRKKRWSQNVYVKIILDTVCSRDNTMFKLTDHSVYILMLDGDTQWNKKSLDIMRNVMAQDDRTGAICGRIIPISKAACSNPVVWYQIFEYAAGHWMQKTAEHVLGTVLCSPGCFSLVRLAALYRRAGQPYTVADDCAIQQYSVEVTEARDVLMLDQGEDRMLSGLIVQNGWTIQYCASAEAVTHCPESFRDFFIQRRRWISSTLANLYHVLGISPVIVRGNSSVSFLFIFYVAATFASSIFGPATIILVVIGAISLAFQWNGAIVYIIGIGIPGWFVMTLYLFNIDMGKDTGRAKAKKLDMQIDTAFAICIIYVIIMTAVSVGIAIQTVADPVGPDSIFLFTIAGIFVITAVAHGEVKLLCYGLVYLLLLPTMYMILVIFAIANLHDQSWGTREAGGDASEAVNKLLDVKGYFLEIMRKFGFCMPKQVDPEAGLSPEEVERRRRLEAEKKKKAEANKKDRRKREEEVKEARYKMKKKREAEWEAQEKALQKQLEDQQRRTPLKERKDALREHLRYELTMLSMRLGRAARVEPKFVVEDGPEEYQEIYNEIIAEQAAKEAEDRVEDLARLQKNSCLLTFTCTAVWLVLVSTLGLHPQLQIGETNAAGLSFLIAFGIVMIVQFVSMVFHRLQTFLTAIATIPVRFKCGLTSAPQGYESMTPLNTQVEEEEEEAKQTWLNNVLGISNPRTKSMKQVHYSFKTTTNLRTG